VGRSQEGLDNQIGAYVHTLPLRVKLDTDEPIDDLLKKVKGVVLNIFRNQSYPDHPHGVSLFDIGITWQNKAEPDTPDSTGPAALKISQQDEDRVIAKNDLWFYGSASDVQIDLTIKYNSDLYKKATMEKLKTDFLQICNDVVNDPKRLVLS
jgi:hypothetical protein